MRRLISAVRADLRLQFRHGFYHVYALVSLAYAAFLFVLTPESQSAILPVLVFSDPAIFGFFLIGALLFYEKGAGSIQLVAVTPLRIWEYVAAKAISLAALALAASILIAVLGKGISFQLLSFLLGVGLVGTLCVLIGLVAVVRFHNFSTYLVGSAPIMVLFVFPLAAYAGVWHSPVTYLVPVTPGFLLIHNAFHGGLSAWQTLLWTAVLLGWNAVFYRWAVRTIEGYIAHPGGGTTDASTS